MSDITDLESLTIQEISLEESNRKNAIGKAFGISLNHCLHLGSKYSSSFIKRVKYYQIIPDEKDIFYLKMKLIQPKLISVEFYE